jgi:hypothetical protein
MTVPWLAANLLPVAKRASWFNLTACEFFHDGSPSLLRAYRQSLTRTTWCNPTASEFFHDGSPGLLPSSHQSLMRTSWLNPAASEFFYDSSPRLVAGPLPVANGKPVV